MDENWQKGLIGNLNEKILEYFKPRDENIFQICQVTKRAISSWAEALQGSEKPVFKN